MVRLNVKGGPLFPQFSEDLEQTENFKRLFPGGTGTFRSSGVAGVYTRADADGRMS